MSQWQKGQSGNPSGSSKKARDRPGKPTVPQETPPAAGSALDPLDPAELHQRVLAVLSAVLDDRSAETTHRLMAARLLEAIRLDDHKIRGSNQFDLAALLLEAAASEEEDKRNRALELELGVPAPWPAGFPKHMTPVERTIESAMDHCRVDRPDPAVLAVPPAPCAPVMTAEPVPEPEHQAEPVPLPCIAFADLVVFPGLD